MNNPINSPNPLIRRIIAAFLLLTALGLAVLVFFVSPPDDSRDIVIFVLGQYFGMATLVVVWYFQKKED